MSEPLVNLKVHGPAGTIILNRPEKHNALSRAMLTQLTQAFRDLHQERGVRAVVLTGAGSAFCTGIDLAEVRETQQSDDPHEQWRDDALAYRNLLDLMLRFPKPIIAGVNGPASAGGAGLVLASDLVVAAREATFGLPDPRRGLVAGMVSPLLAFRIGGSQAARLLLTAELIDADEAHRRGLFHEIVENDVLWARCAELARRCEQSAPEALQLTKKMLNETVAEHLDTMLSAGAAVSATAHTTEAAAEGVAAFLEKRQPKWP